MKRYFWQRYSQDQSVAFFETTEFGPNQGYATEKEAVEAALRDTDESLKNHRNSIEQVRQKLFSYIDRLEQLYLSREKITEALREIK